MDKCIEVVHEVIFVVHKHVAIEETHLAFKIRKVADSLIETLVT